MASKKRATKKKGARRRGVAARKRSAPKTGKTKTFQIRLTERDHTNLLWWAARRGLGKGDRRGDVAALIRTLIDEDYARHRKRLGSPPHRRP